jgi:membrane associated rhomboid family serine protease
MADKDLLLRVLEACSRAAPAPLFPAQFAAEASLDRSHLDAALDRLRLNGYLQIADWVQGKGQGYTLTSEGTDALRDPARLDRPAPAPKPEPEPRLRTSRTWERGETVRNALVEPCPPRITMLLLFANLAVYAIGLVLALQRGMTLADYLNGERGQGQLLDSLGSVSSFHVIAEHQWWRLLSHQFLHGNLLHVGMNMLALYMLGQFLEALWGSTRYLLLYLISGFVGGAAVVMAGSEAVGASGAICGLLTSLGVWVWLNRDCLPEQVSAYLMSRVGMNLVLLVIISLQPRVSWQGHLGGAIGGALVSIPLHYDRFGLLWQRLVSWFAIIAIPLASAAAAYLIQRPHFAEVARDRANSQYERRLVSVEEFLFARYNRFIVPLLNKDAANWRQDPQFVAKSKEACEESIVKLQPLLADFNARIPNDPVETVELLNTQRYFEAWGELFHKVGSLMDEPEQWTASSGRKLVRQVNTLFEFRAPLEENTVLPRFSKLRTE